MPTAELLFELSHPTRLAILRTVDAHPERLTKIAEGVDARHPETSRHLDRLSAAGLVERTPEGAYQATPLGHLLLGSLSALEFIVDHEAYFRDHDLSGLPPAFVARLGDLRECDVPGGTFTHFAQDEKIFEGAAQQLEILTTELPGDAMEAIEAKVSQGVAVHVIVDEAYAGPEVTGSIRHLFRRVPKIPVAAVVSEEAACLSFPALNGQMDYASFFASIDPRFLRWCVDFSRWLWEQGAYFV